jgi:uncharacterized protein (DUF4415 family)
LCVLFQLEKQPQRRRNNINILEKGDIMDEMRAEYDFSNSRPNPYAKKLKKQVTINIDNDSIDYFKAQSETIGVPYQTLINLYLSDCVTNKKQLKVAWN